MLWTIWPSLLLDKQLCKQKQYQKIYWIHLFLPNLFVLFTCILCSYSFQQFQWRRQINNLSAQAQHQHLKIFLICQNYFNSDSIHHCYFFIFFLFSNDCSHFRSNQKSFAWWNNIWKIHKRQRINFYICINFKIIKRWNRKKRLKNLFYC